MHEINLSFVITTRNRLEYLKIVLEDIILSREDDEEIVVVDALSNDGTSEYLNNLYSNKKIQKLLIESDRCQAEGWNKGFLFASGKIIKKVTDDDIFDLASIRLCKRYMLENQEFDLCISNELFTDDRIYPNFNKHSFFEDFKKWRKKEIISFFFSDPHILIRNQALCYIGIYNPRFTMIDYEYSLRISFLQAKIVYYTGYNSTSYFRNNTVSGLINKKALNEEYRTSDLLYKHHGQNKSLLQLWRFEIFSLIRRIITTRSIKPVYNPDSVSFREKYFHMQKTMERLNTENKTFISNV